MKEKTVSFVPAREAEFGLYFERIKNTKKDILSKVRIVAWKITYWQQGEIDEVRPVLSRVVQHAPGSGEKILLIDPDGKIRDFFGNLHFNSLEEAQAELDDLNIEVEQRLGAAI